MQFITDVQQRVANFASENASTLLTAGGVVGTVTTAVLAGRAGFKAGQVVLKKKGELYAEQFGDADVPDNPYLDLDKIQVPRKELFVSLVPEFLPPVVTGSATVASIIFANRMSAQKAAALAAAYGLAERNLAEYKEKVSEKLTGPKREAVKDELAQEAVNRTPGSDNVVIVEGEVLCFDKPGGRYFNSTMERIRQAVNSTNAEVFNHGFATLDFFYNELGLEDTTWSQELGFNAENLLEVSYSTTFAPGNRPCIVIDFARLPKADYDPKLY